jgi:hypothetical protein
MVFRGIAGVLLIVSMIVKKSLGVWLLRLYCVGWEFCLGTVVVGVGGLVLGVF